MDRINWLLYICIYSFNSKDKIQAMSMHYDFGRINWLLGCSGLEFPRSSTNHIPTKSTKRTYVDIRSESRIVGALLGLSTTHALVSFFHQLDSLSDIPNQCVRILLLDFSKAFNRINNFLITKIEGVRIDPILIAWVRNFLTGRKQRVKIVKFVPSLGSVN